MPEISRKKTPRPIWEGLKVGCIYCRHERRLTKSSKVTLKEHTRGTEPYFAVSCPKCHSEVTFEQYEVPPRPQGSESGLSRSPR
jgi:hypothetical protein